MEAMEATAVAEVAPDLADTVAVRAVAAVVADWGRGVAVVEAVDVVEATAAAEVAPDLADMVAVRVVTAVWAETEAEMGSLRTHQHH